MTEMKIAIIGVGNAILKDEALGVFMAQLIPQKYRFEPSVDFHVVGTGSLAIADICGCYGSVLILDAVLTDALPGTLVSIDYKGGGGIFKTEGSGHARSLQAGLEMAEFMSDLPETIRILGVVPAEFGFGESFSPVVEEALLPFEKMILEELRDLGVICTPSTSTKEPSGSLICQNSL